MSGARCDPPSQECRTCRPDRRCIGARLHRSPRKRIPSGIDGGPTFRVGAGVELDPWDPDAPTRSHGATLCNVGMFDYYDPVPALECPWCGAPFKVWQGKEGPNALLVWRQGHEHPVDQRVVPESRGDLNAFSLPTTFVIAGSCVNEHVTNARCRCIDRVWQDIAFDEAEQRRAEEWRRDRSR